MPGDTAHVRVRRDATWQQITDGLVVSSDGTVRLRIVERTDGMYDVVEQTATGTTVTVSWANCWTDAEWELRRLQERNTPAEIASGVEMEHGNRVPPEECILKNDVAEETEQATLIPDGGTVEDGTSHVGPIIFADETARSQLTGEGEVVTFRESQRTTGPTWWRESRTGPKKGDVRVEEIGKIDLREDRSVLAEYAEKSGFASVEDWVEAIRNLNGSPTYSGYLYRVTSLNTRHLEAETEGGDRDA